MYKRQPLHNRIGVGSGAAILPDRGSLLLRCSVVGTEKGGVCGMDAIRTKQNMVTPAPTAHPDPRMHMTLKDAWGDDGKREVYPLARSKTRWPESPARDPDAIGEARKGSTGKE